MRSAPSTTARARPSGPPTAPRCCSRCRSAGRCGCTAQPVAGGTPERIVNERGAVGSVLDGKERRRLHVREPVGSGAVVRDWRPGRRHACKVTDLNAAVLGGRRLAEVESFTFVSNDNKFEVEAFLTKPIGLASAESGAGSRTRYPLIVNIHGGPHGQQGPASCSRTRSTPPAAGRR